MIHDAADERSGQEHRFLIIPDQDSVKTGSVAAASGVGKKWR